MKRRNGFTLVEMLTVVLIIGILTAVAVPQYRRATQKAKYSEALSMLRTIYDASERLASASGYKSYNAFQNAEPGNATFGRMGLLDGDNTRCQVSSSQSLVCENFEYVINDASVIVARRLGNGSDKKTQIFLHRGDLSLKCKEGGSGNKVCDVINLPLEPAAAVPAIPFPGTGHGHVVGGKIDETIGTGFGGKIKDKGGNILRP